MPGITFQILAVLLRSYILLTLKTLLKKMTGHMWCCMLLIPALGGRSEQISVRTRPASLHTTL